MLKLIEPAEHAAGVQSVNRAQILAAAIGESFGLLLGMSEAKPGGGGHAIDEEDLVTRELCELGVLHHFVEMGLAISDVRRQRRIEAAENASEVATFDPCARAHGRDLQIGDGKIS